MRIVAGAAFLACIILANVLTNTYGMVPVAPGLEATAGTYAAGVTFLARDVLHRYAGRRVTLVLIVIGAALSALVSPALAVASGVTFLVAELADYSTYVPLQRYGFVVAALVSNVIGATVDTLLFLPLAGFPVTPDTVAGQIVGKLILTTPLLLAWEGARRAVFR